MRLSIVVAVLAALAGCAWAEPEKSIRIDPPNWWAGFEDPHLHLLVRGDGVGDLTPTLTHPGVSIEAVEPGVSRDYLFVDLLIGPEAPPGVFEIAFLDGDRVMAAYDYELAVRRDGSADRRGFDASDVIYLIVPDRFANGDPANDTIAGLEDGLDRDAPGGRHGGDLKGIEDNLDYLADLGVTAVWPTPIVENAQARFSYHGYAATDHYRVDPRFGTNEDYRRLVAAARGRGMCFIQDIVLNHIGDEHVWASQPPQPDWINNGGEFAFTTHLRTSLEDPYAAEVDRAGFTQGWFTPRMPDLNQDNPRLAQYLIQNSLWWIEYADLCGVRLDTYAYPGPSFLGAWMDRVLAEYPNLNVVGEEWSGQPSVVAKWQRPRDGAPAGAPLSPSLMDFPLQQQLVRRLLEPDGWSSGLLKLYEFLANDRLYEDPFNLVTILYNHDFDRIHTQLLRDVELTRLAVAYHLTMRGIPQIFYGTEILMANERPGDHGDIRSDFPGGWPGDARNAFTGAGLSAEEAEFQDWMRRLLNWRKASPAIHHGDLRHYGPVDTYEGGSLGKHVYVYFRYTDDQTVMVVLNKADVDAPLDLARYYEVLSGKTQARDILTGETYGLADGLIAPARAPMIFEIE